jgi:hypothetical protein
MYPPEVQRRYAKHAFGIGVNEDYTTFATFQLTYEILDDRNTFLGIANRLERAYQAMEAQAKDEYVDFVMSYGSESESDAGTRTRQTTLSFAPRAKAPARPLLVWPEFDDTVFRTENQPPKEDAVKKLFNLSYALVEEFLLRDLYSRAPTRIISWDVTFELLGKTMEDILSDGEQNGLAIIFDEYSRVLNFAFVDHERPDHWKRMHYYLRERCDYLGVDPNIVEVGYSDLGDENVKDRTAHWFPKIWPNAKDAPLKDIFHAVKMVTGPLSVRGKGSDLHANFCRDLSAVVLRFEEESLRLAVEAFCSMYPDKSPEIARVQVQKLDRWKKKMYNYTVPIEEAVQNCNRLWDDLSSVKTIVWQSKPSNKFQHKSMRVTFFRLFKTSAGVARKKSRILLSYSKGGAIETPSRHGR